MKSSASIRISLSSLFRDEQRKIVGLILNDSLTSAAAAYRTIYENQAPLIRFLNSLNIPVPAAFKAAADVAINSQVKQAFERPDLDADNIQSYLKEAATSRVPLDTTTLEFTIRKRLEEQAARFAEHPDDMENCATFSKATGAGANSAISGNAVGSAKYFLRAADEGHRGAPVGHRE